jgi:hypothetical protein
MRHESCFCQNCGHYNAEAGVAVSKQADEIARLRKVLEALTDILPHEEWSVCAGAISSRAYALAIVERALKEVKS